MNTWNKFISCVFMVPFLIMFTNHIQLVTFVYNLFILLFVNHTTMFAILKDKKQCSLWNFFQDKLKMNQGGKDLLHVKYEWTMMKTTCNVHKSTLSNSFFISVNHVCNEHHVKLKLVLNYYRLTHHLSLLRGLQECNHINFIVKENYCMKFKDVHVGWSNPTHTNAPLCMDANWAWNFSHLVPMPQLSSSN